MLVKKGIRKSARTAFFSMADFSPEASPPGIPIDQPPDSLGIRQTYSAQQVGVAGVGAHPVPERVYCEIDHSSRMLFVTLFEQPECLVFVAEVRINSRNLIEIDIGMRGQVPKFLGNVQSISPPARDGVNPTKAASNELILYSYSFVLIWNFVVFGNGLRIHALHCICPR